MAALVSACAVAQAVAVKRLQLFCRPFGSLLVVLLTGCRPPEPADARQVQDWRQLIDRVADGAGLQDAERWRVQLHASLALYEAHVEPMSGFASLAGQLNGLWSIPRRSESPLDAATVAVEAVRLVVDSLLPAGRPAFDSLAGLQLDERRAAGVRARLLERSRSHGKALAAAILAWAGSGQRTFALRHPGECSRVAAPADSTIGVRQASAEPSAIGAAEDFLLVAVASADGISAARAAGSAWCVEDLVRRRLRTRSGPR